MLSCADIEGTLRFWSTNPVALGSGVTWDRATRGFVAQTWECFTELKQRWCDTGLESHGAAYELRNEVSIAKAVLQAMHIGPPRHGPSPT